MKEPSVELLRPDGFDEIFKNATSLRNWLPQKSDEIEEARRLPADVVRQLVQAGMFRMNMPESWGGPELTSMEQVRIIEEVSRGDASAGWCVMIGCDSGIYSGYLEDEVARDLYPHLDMIQAGWVYPVGRAEEIDGGAYRVSGNWMFCSGCTHADMIAAGCTVYRNGEPVLNARGTPEWRLVIAPASHWQIKDTWYTTGLRGTGSNDYTTLSDHLIVPREHSFSFFEPKREGVLWRRADTLLRKMSGIPLGMARQRIEDVRAMMEAKVDPLNGKPYRNLARIKSAIAEAEMILERARTYVYAALESEWETLSRGEELSTRQRADLWLSRLSVFQSAREVVRILYDIVGGSAIYAMKGPMDRAVRDAETMCQHMVGQRKGLEDIGALLLNSDEQSGSPMI